MTWDNVGEEEGKDFLTHIATEEEFKLAGSLVAEFRKALKNKETSEEAVMLLVSALGEQVTYIHSYLYQFTMEECIQFNEWVLSYLIAKRNSETINSLEHMYHLDINNNPSAE